MGNKQPKLMTLIDILIWIKYPRDIAGIIMDYWKEISNIKFLGKMEIPHIKNTKLGDMMIYNDLLFCVYEGLNGRYDVICIFDIKTGKLISKFDCKTLLDDLKDDDMSESYRNPYYELFVKDKRIYVSDSYTRKLRIFDIYGNFIKERDNMVMENGGIFVDEFLYIVKPSYNQVDVRTIDGEFVKSFGRKGVNSGKFNYPTGITIDKIYDRMFIADTQNNRVSVHKMDGSFVTHIDYLDGVTQAIRIYDNIITTNQFGNVKICKIRECGTEILAENSISILKINGYDTNKVKIQVVNNRLYIRDPVKNKLFIYEFVY